MFVLNHDSYRIPIKVWLGSGLDLELECLEQAENLARLPFVYRHVALMPDTHSGYGMPIGGVIATEDVVIPNAVGVDIGCGMLFVETDVPVIELKEAGTHEGNMINKIIGKIDRSIPTGFSKHQIAQSCVSAGEIDHFSDICEHVFYPEVMNMHFQVGTLGGGNHFIELQEDENGFLCIMIHSGSRNFGYKVANYFNKLAVDLNKKFHSSVPKNYELAFLPVDSKEGMDYLSWMGYALKFAKENRSVMLDRVKEAIDFTVSPFRSVEYKNRLNVHHNYASLEKHFGKFVFVHRKGATSAKAGELGIIPGAMGSFSYIVEGKGNIDSFNSCSHGAGRKMSRTKALETFTVQQMMDDLKEKDVVLSIGNGNKENVVDESRFAYKDVEDVMRNQDDLVRVVKKLKTVGVVKASDSGRKKKNNKGDVTPL